MVSFPRICENMAFLPATDDVRWSNDDRKFTLWCQGKTGYPIVDAGMRQLNTVGYMNSRVRKIVQCFLVKDLMVSWQKGEKYFMSHLIDGEMASVNGSWQWVSYMCWLCIYVRSAFSAQYLMYIHVYLFGAMIIVRCNWSRLPAIHHK